MKVPRHRQAASSVLALLLLLLSGLVAQAEQSKELKVDPEAARNYSVLANGVSAARLASTIRQLSGIKYAVPSGPGLPPVVANSRLAGTPGGDQAQNYVRGQFQQIFGGVKEEPFPVTVPMDQGAFVRAGAKSYALRPFWPNLVRTSTLPQKGIDGPLIYAGRGDLRSFRGKPLESSIVLLDFNCGTQWLNAPRLGAKALIFVEPTQTMRGEAESKFIGIPVAIPRFYISRADAANLQSAALTTSNFSVHLECNNPWETHQALNFIGVVPGTDPVLSKQVVVIESYYDSMSVVPTLAPGAESACGLASLLELARAFKADPPKRTILFVACGAHFLGMQGVRTYVDKHLDEWLPTSAMDKLFHRKFPNRQNVLLFSGLDLSSQTGSVGVFYKGYFYDYREDIQGDFSDIGRTLRENAAKIGQTLGFDPGTAFADGINPTNGKGWRNYLPGRFAFDAETATLAGGRGITFASTDDARQTTDTPADTFANINVANLAQQTRLLACEYWHLLNDTNDPNLITTDSVKGLMPVADTPAWTRQGLRLGYSKVQGRVLLFDPKTNFVPDQPIVDSLAVIGNPSKTMMGVRGNLIQATQGGPTNASFEFPGLPLVISNGSGLRFGPNGPVHIGAYHIYQGNKLIVSNLPQTSDDKAANSRADKDLRALLAQAGAVVSIGSSGAGSESGSSRSLVVEMATQEQAARAMTLLNGQNLGGRPLKVAEFFATRGDIDFAPDQGVNGAANYPTEFDLTSDLKQTQVIVFPCVATSIYDLIDQQAFKSLTGVHVLDGATDGDPRQYGFILAGNEPGVSYVEDVAVLFSQPGASTRLKVLMDSGPGATRFLLINSLAYDPSKTKAENQHDAQGIGYAVGVESARFGGSNAQPDPNNPDDVVRNGAITNTALRVAMDMWNLDEFRISQLAKFRIVNDVLSNKEHTGLHDIAHEYILKALAAYKLRDYDAFDAYSRQAWAYEAKVYPQAQGTANDVVQGVIFYLFLLIPFAYFAERLLVGAVDLKRQLLWVFVIFLGIFFIFSQIHPAFDITINPIIVLIAFVMLALSVIVSLLVWGKFEEQLKALNKTVSGVHKAEVGRASIAFAAFALGISNMRRRKERTLLTCITLVLLTFTVLSFTSIENYTRTNKVDAPGVSLYNGLLLRVPTWDPLQEPAYRLLNDEYGSQAKTSVAPRAWFYGTQQGQQTFLTLKRADISTDVKGVVGFTPEEANVTGADKTLAAGRWFNSSDSYSALIPRAVADSLQITDADVGKVQVNFSGVPFLVIGIVDPDKFKAIKDLDNEALTPVDFISQQQQSSTAASTSAASAGFQEYLHLDPNNCLYVPYRTLINMGGDLRSVGINFGNANATHTALENLMPRLDLNLYAGENGKNYRFSATGATKSSGLANIIIPIAIAALIVLNTMLGSVYERVKEIGIFSSIGLSPVNIAMLFIAEALVYAIIGAVGGYLIGQALSKVISVFHILPGLYLNFSSTSAEMSIGLVIAVVLLSTIFPARKASEVATPAVDRTWRVPEPEGDVWRIMLPFAVTGAQAKGINSFLAEWFRSYEEQSVGDFLTQGIRTGSHTTAGGEGYRLTGRVWLAPFDLGVSQDISLDTVPTDLEDVFEVHLMLTRLSGDVSNWKRVNRRFLNVLRKQFLIWRTLSADQRERYLESPDVRHDGTTPTPPAVGAAAVPAAL